MAPKGKKVRQLEDIHCGWQSEDGITRKDAELRKQFGITKQLTVALERPRNLNVAGTKGRNRSGRGGKREKGGSSYESKNDYYLKRLKALEDYGTSAELNKEFGITKRLTVPLVALSHKNSRHLIGTVAKIPERNLSGRERKKETHHSLTESGHAGNAPPLKSPKKGCKRHAISQEDCKEGRKRRVLKKTSPIKFYCEDCEAPFSSLVTFKMHLKEYHNSNRKKHYPCLICAKSFVGPRFLYGHYKMKHPGETKKCINCSTRFKASQFATHGNAPALKCPQKGCERIYYCVKLFDTHLRGHSLSHTCKTCGRKFTTFKYMMTHIRCVHEKEKRVFCKCGKGFFFTEGLKRHQRSCLSNKSKEFSCDVCGYRFSTKCHVKRHIFHVHLSRDLHYCRKCRKNFPSKKALDMHVKKVHKEKGHFVLPEKDLECYICKAKFNTTQNLMEHIKSHVKREHTFYPCKTCGKMVRDANWKVHYYSHFGRYIYTCEICEFQFKFKWALRFHIRVHFPQPKRFKCDRCWYRGYSKSCIRRHVMHHFSPQRDFMCAYCKSPYTTKSSVKQHIMIKHEGEEIRILSNES